MSRTASSGVVAVLCLAACASPNYDLRRCARGAAVRQIAGRADDGLRVVTVNMWGIPLLSRDLEVRFAALGERLRGDDADVVALQEMWADAPRRRLLEEIRGEFPFQADFQSQYGRGGLVIVSRHPFVGRPQFVPFAATGKWWKPWTGEWWGGKGVGAVHLQLDATRLWLFTAHLHACYEDSEGACDVDDEYAAYRWEQLRTVRAAVNALAGDEPALIVGDFNFTRRSRYFDYLTRNEADGQPALQDPAWMHVEEPGAPLRRIDHVFVRPGSRSSLQVVEPARVTFTRAVDGGDGNPVPLSDHCAITATLAPHGAVRRGVPTSVGSEETGRI